VANFTSDENHGFGESSGDIELYLLSPVPAGASEGFWF
jgi:hypothetical protein